MALLGRCLRRGVAPGQRGWDLSPELTQRQPHPTLAWQGRERRTQPTPADPRHLSHVHTGPPATMEAPNFRTGERRRGDQGEGDQSTAALEGTVEKTWASGHLLGVCGTKTQGRNPFGGSRGTTGQPGGGGWGSPAAFPRFQTNHLSRFGGERENGAASQTPVGAGDPWPRLSLD